MKLTKLHVMKTPRNVFYSIKFLTAETILLTSQAKLFTLRSNLTIGHINFGAAFDIFIFLSTEIGNTISLIYIEKIDQRVSNYKNVEMKTIPRR